jgi:hypothetical protein
MKEAGGEDRVLRREEVRLKMLRDGGEDEEAVAQ